MNLVYEEKDIGVICPLVSCQGKLKRTGKISKKLFRYTCEKCKRKMILDNKGCGTYE